MSMAESCICIMPRHACRHGMLPIAVLTAPLRAQITPTNVDIAAVAPMYHLYSQAEIEEVVSRL